MWRHASDKALSICQVHPPSTGVGVASTEYINNDTPLTRKATSDIFTSHFHLPFHLIVAFVALKEPDIPEIIAMDLVFENFKDVFLLTFSLQCHITFRKDQELIYSSAVIVAV